MSRAPDHDNFNEKITAECYRPNATAGVFEGISFDLGPTLANWLEAHHPDVHQRIMDSAGATANATAPAMRWRRRTTTPSCPLPRRAINARRFTGG